jgi:diguanylate cyclase (GGDEF)-like protein/PAS domain S-box-containing protein
MPPRPNIDGASPRHRGGFAAWLVCVALLLLPPVATAQQADLSDRRVLLLYSYHPGFPSSAPMLAGVRSVLSPRGVRLDLEYMDGKRHADAVIQEQFRRLLALRLARRPGYDVILVADDRALEFALTHHEELFASRPLVFLGVNSRELALAQGANPLVSGVVEDISVAETLALARRLDPELATVYAVVDDTPSGRGDRARLETVRKRQAGFGLEVLSLAELSWDELAVRIRALPANSALLKMAMFTDREGVVKGNAESSRFLRETRALPVYGLREHVIEHGVVGGVVVSFFEQGRHAARQALRILDGAAVASIPVLARSPNRTMVDAAAMAALGLSLQRVPEGAVVRNLPDSRLERVQRQLHQSMSVAAALGGCAILLAWLLITRSLAQRKLQASEARYRAMIEGSSQGVLIHRFHRTLFVNDAYARMLGYDSAQEILELGATTALYAAHERERMRGYQAARRRGQPAPTEYDYEALRKDGSVVMLHNLVQTTTWNGRFATQHNVIDVTEQRRNDALVRESEERYRLLVQNAPDAIVVIDDDSGRIVDANDKALTLFGFQREELLGRSDGDLHGQEADARGWRWSDYVERARSGEVMTFEWLHRVAGDRRLPTEVRLTHLSTPAGGAVRASISDVSERQRAQMMQRRQSLQLQGILENIDEGVSMMDAELNVVAYNQRFLELLQLPESLMYEGVPFADVIRHNAQRGEYGEGDVEAQVRERVVLALRFEDHSFVRSRPDGTVLEIRGKALPGGGMVSTYRDITENHRLSQQLAYHASHDELTDLSNRREFELRVTQALHEAVDEGREHAVCYLDLDQFKVVNDTCGHVAGDELLRQLAGTLRTHIRSGDMLARLGGDEFGVLLGDCDVSNARRIARELRGVVEEFRFAWQDKSFRLGVSIGLVPVNGTSGTVADVLSAADSACYAAKDQGRNRIHVYNLEDAELAHRHSEMEWVVHIQHALEEDRFELASQRIVPVNGGAGEGLHFELLLRMLDEDGGSVAPGVFLPAAERYNLITHLDRWVVSRALAQLAADRSMLDSLFQCSINLSGHSLANDDFLAFVQEQFTRTGVPGDRICFEITETAAIANLSRAQEFMNTLKALGCSFALDDFGSGLSSFAYLKALPVDYLKIDGAFVKDIVDDPIDFAMVKSINEVGHVMGKRTIAEFVENEAVLARLQALGVDYAQGYGIGRPQPFALTPGLRKAS